MPQYSRSILEKELMKGERLPVGWPWRLLIFSSFLFLSALLVYLGMIIGYQPYLKSKISDLDKKIEELNKSISDEQKDALIVFYSQLTNVYDLFNSHIKISDFLEFFSKNTHSGVYFNNFDLSLKDRTLRLDGAASDYEVLAQQIEQFRRSPDVVKVIISNSQLKEKEKEVIFSLRLTLDNRLFKF